MVKQYGGTRCFRVTEREKYGLPFSHGICNVARTFSELNLVTLWSSSSTSFIQCRVLLL